MLSNQQATCVSTCDLFTSPALLEIGQFKLECIAGCHWARAVGQRAESEHDNRMYVLSSNSVPEHCGSSISFSFSFWIKIKNKYREELVVL